MNKEILLVDDNEQEAQLVIRSLAKSYLPNVLRYIDDGEEAVDYLFRRGKYTGEQDANLPGLLLLDLKMPRMNGLEVLRKLKADPRTRWIPVVMLTSSREESDLKACYEAGANSYVVKPVDYETLAGLVKEIGSYWMGRNMLPGMNECDAKEE